MLQFVVCTLQALSEVIGKLGLNLLPEVRLYHAVQTLVKGSRGEIACPVVILTICVGKEISTKNRVVCRS